MNSSARASVSSCIAALLDENSFVGVGAYITARSTNSNTTEQETPTDGVVAGYGTIGGYLVYVRSQDASVLGGSMGEMHAKKIYNIYFIAMKVGAPIIGLVDCMGLRFQEVTDAPNGFGKLYLSQTMTSGVISQITAIFGTRGGGMAIPASITDSILMGEKSDKLFVNSPNTIDDNYKEGCDTSGADFQSREPGLIGFTGDEDSIIAQIRALVSILSVNNENSMSYEECQNDLNRIYDNIEGCTGDTAPALTLISDSSFLVEVKKDYEPPMMTGSIRLNRIIIGCVANCTKIYESGEKKETFEPVLSGKDRDKAAGFINLCDASNIPILTPVNAKGYKVRMCSERRIAKATARLIYAYANASVSRVTIIVKEVFESTYLTINSKPIGTDVIYIRPDAVIGMMNPSKAIKVMYTKEIAVSGDTAALINEKIAECTALQPSAVTAVKGGYVGDIMKIGETRQEVVATFEMLFTKKGDRPSRKHGTT